ncbi:MAG: type 4 pilus major pilin [Alphaproteobacteria bacterium]
MMKTNESGRSMIEMLGVLAIIGVLSVGGIAGYSKAMMQYKINKTVDQISQVVGNVRTLFGSQKNYTALGYSGNQVSLIKKAHLAPDELWNAAGTDLENAFGGYFHITYGKKKTDGDNKAFGVVLSGIPEDPCMALATYDWGSGSSSGLIAISVNDSTVYGMATTVGCAGSSAAGKAIGCPNGATVTVPMPVNIAATACATGDGNWISLKFY